MIVRQVVVQLEGKLKNRVFEVSSILKINK